jgi:serine protease Do
MNRFKKSLSVAVMGGVAAAGWMFGAGMVKDVQFARAEQQVQTSREQLKGAEDMSTVFREVGKVVEPSVVNIRVSKSIKGVHRSLPFDDDMLRRFFPDRDGDGEPDVPPGLGGGDQPDMEQIGTGSGVIMEVSGSDAYVLTNNHVAGGADEMVITLSDGREIHNGKLLGADAKSDLAVVKINADHLIPAKWGDSSNLLKGDWVVAFGSPFGYVGSMTHGIVSALNRTTNPAGGQGLLGKFGYENFIQVDAPINPGNSGGPLVNLHGEVIGINTAIASRSGGFQGIGFAIPSNQAKFVYGQLKEKGKVTRGWLGVAIASVSDVHVAKLAESFGYTGHDGVFVQEVMDNTPATGKLQAGDIITAVDGKPVKDVTQLRNLIAATAPNTPVKFSVFRDKKEQDITVKLGDQPDDLKMAKAGSSADQGESVDLKSGLGVSLGDVNDQIIEQFGLDENTKGAVVKEVAPKSAASRELRPGDVITKVGDTAVHNAKEAKDALAKADLSKGIRLYVVSRDGSRFVFIQSDEK